LQAIAQAYDMDVELLKNVNNIRDSASLQAGARLWIPGAQRVMSTDGKNSFGRRSVVKDYLAWPLHGGALTSRFGMRWGRKHEGIDIGADIGTPIRAAAEGKVMFSGWGPTGYGRMVIIKHPKNHLSTLYAHTSSNLVEKNDYVHKGQIIAKVGETGRATGPHLHFEVRNDTHPKDPLLYLPN
jgi:murein DD-endopeptidase MepM/ murein hydrolase activator NlpD